MPGWIRASHVKRKFFSPSSGWPAGAITLFTKKAAPRQGLPFEVRIPNAETEATSRSTDAGRDLVAFKTADDLIRDLEKTVKTRIIRAMGRLADNPRPKSCRKLNCKEPLYRIRAGDYRIIHEIRDASLLVLVVKVGHRRDIYRRSG